MFLVAPMLAAAIPGVLSGVASFFGARGANKANRQEAQKNRDFQERMRNTEWQAGVADMQAAGINPAVAYSRGGASAPSGNVAAPAIDSVGAGVSSAMAANAQRKGIELMTQQVEGQKAANIKAFAEGAVATREAHMQAQKYGYYFDLATGRPKPALQQLLDAEFNSSQANSARSVSDAQLAAFSVPERQAIAKLFETVGSGGKGMQIMLPLLMTLMRGGR